MQDCNATCGGLLSTSRFARVRPLAPWLLRDALRALLVVLLAAVSAYYLTRWAIANRMPVALAWTLPVVFDASALLGLIVARRPADARARKTALWFAGSSAAASAVGNGAMHAVDFGELHVSLWTVVVTGAVYPVMLALAYHVAGGMAQRPAAAKDPAKAEEPTDPSLWLAMVLALANMAALSSAPKPRQAPNRKTSGRTEEQREADRERQALRRARLEAHKAGDHSTCDPRRCADAPRVRVAS